jgi:hypothetical protein
MHAARNPGSFLTQFGAGPVPTVTNTPPMLVPQLGELGKIQIGFVAALKSFATEADNADWAVVYFAGHGIEMGGTNNLIPIDAKLLTDRDVELEAVPSGQVMHAIDGARQLHVVILDACRDNPFADMIKRTGGDGRNIGRGLAKVEPARGTLVFYAAKEGP